MPQNGGPMYSGGPATEFIPRFVLHELRGPLTHILGFARLIAEQHSADMTEKGLRFLSRIEEAGGKLARLLDGLSRINQVCRAELHPQQTALDPLVEDVAGLLARENPQRIIEWRLSPLPPTVCDPSMMKEVFVCLLSNAVKFTRPRERAVIEVGSFTQSGGPVFFVRDNGIGFHNDRAGHLFEAFRRMHRPEEFDGDGVGLAVVQRVLLRHGGRVWAEAEPDRGATFFFALEASGEGHCLESFSEGEALFQR